MRKKTRILSIILALITVSCFLFALGAGAFAADADEKKNVTPDQLIPGFLKVTTDTIEFHLLNTEYEYRITTNEGKAVTGYPDWTAPQAFAIIFENLESDTTYVVEARMAADKSPAGTMLVNTATLLNLVPLMIVLALILFYEIVVVAMRISKRKKLTAKTLALAPIFVLGIYIPVSALIIILVELVLIAVAGLFVVNVRKPEEIAEEVAEEAEKTAEEEKPAENKVEVIVVKTSDADE